MTISNNPLRQYFRRPSVYMKLPSEGKFYPPEVFVKPENGEVPVYPMTAVDEITAQTPDALFNGQAVVDIIKSCVPSIKDPWKLNSMDLDAVLIAIKSASLDGGMEVGSQCPSCSEVTNYKIDLPRLLAGIKPANYTEPMRVGDLEIFFRPLTYKEMTDIALKQFEMQRKYQNIDDIEDIQERVKVAKQALVQVNEATINALAGTIFAINLPGDITVTEKDYILEYLKNCDKNTFDEIKQGNVAYKESGEIKPIDYKCPHCKHEYKQSLSLNVSDFFG